MNPEIKGLNYRDIAPLKDYGFDAPEGSWEGILDDHAWGKSTNIFLYFTNVATGEKHRLSVFSRNQYQPYEEGPNFKLEELGGRYAITTAKSAKGLPKFLKAQRLDQNSKSVKKHRVLELVNTFVSKTR